MLTLKEALCNRRWFGDYQMVDQDNRVRRLREGCNGGYALLIDWTGCGLNRMRLVSVVALGWPIQIWNYFSEKAIVMYGIFFILCCFIIYNKVFCDLIHKND